jgi:hypothetical protein
VSQERWLELLEFFEGDAAECQSAVCRYEGGGGGRELADALRRLTQKLNQRPDPMLSQQADRSDIDELEAFMAPGSWRLWERSARA